MQPKVLLRLFAVPLMIAVGAAFVVRATVVRLYAIPSSSMEPALVPGDVIAVTPLSYELPGSSPRSGDVVVFRAPAGDQLLVKRIVAGPGDHVQIVRGRIRVNGYTLAEPYVQHYDAEESTPPEILPADAFYVVGDRRTDSVDSRSWGFVDREAIVGRAAIVVWSARPSLLLRPAARAETLSSGATSRTPAVRFDRILRPVR